jgi:hypothetical protein
MTPYACFPLSRVLLLAASGLGALAGLFAAASARDAGFSMFGLGLFGFGVLFALSLIKRGFDEAEVASFAVASSPRDSSRKNFEDCSA